MSERASTGPVLSLRGIRKSFGDTAVLRGIDLDIDKHEVVALIGASGSGKSTLLRTANLLEPIDDGQVFLGGADVSDPRVKLDAVRARIGVVFQHYNLFPHLSVLDNVTLASRAVQRTSKKVAEQRGLELLAQVGLADKAREFPDRLSGGQQQRVAIVRAIATDPELLLLDEITSALDPELVGEVLQVIKELADEGWTMVVVTHELSFARQAADEVLFMDGGVVVERGAPGAIFTNPTHERTRRFLDRILRPLEDGGEGDVSP